METKASNTLALQQAFSRLRKSNQWLRLGLSENDFQSEELSAYLQRPLGENIAQDIETENKIKAAVYLSITRSKWKPRWVAKKLAESAVEAMRDARLTCLYESNKISAKDYKTETEKNQITQISTTFKHIKKRYGRKTAKTALTAALALTVGGPASWIAGGIMLTSELLTKTTKEKIKRKIKNTVERTVQTITNGITHLYNKTAEIAPKVIEKVVDIANDIKENASQYAAPIANGIRTVVHSISSTIKECGTVIKEKTKKLWKWITGR